jgi:microcompartment protein CcmK/EutM
MLIASVVGTVVATRKDERLVSNKLLIVRPVSPQGKPEGGYLVAVDTVDAGFGETVLIGAEGLSGRHRDCRHHRSHRTARRDFVEHNRFTTAVARGFRACEGIAPRFLAGSSALQRAPGAQTCSSHR